MGPRPRQECCQRTGVSHWIGTHTQMLTVSAHELTFVQVHLLQLLGERRLPQPQQRSGEEPHLAHSELDAITDSSPARSCHIYRTRRNSSPLTDARSRAALDINTSEMEQAGSSQQPQGSIDAVKKHGGDSPAGVGVKREHSEVVGEEDQEHLLEVRRRWRHSEKERRTRQYARPRGPQPNDARTLQRAAYAQLKPDSRHAVHPG